MYIDILCSKHGKGRALIEAVEKFASEMRGVRLVALRAAWSGLLGYYRKLGYERITNACKADSREQRNQKKQLDENAVEFKGRQMLEGHAEWWWMSKCLYPSPELVPS